MKFQFDGAVAAWSPGEKGFLSMLANLRNARKNTMKMLFRILSVAMLLSLVLSACTATTTSTPAADRTIVIRAGTGDGGDGLTPHQQIIQNFEDANPNVIVQLEPVSGRDYYARLLTQLAAKAAPDIMQIGDDAVPSFVTKNAFVPLDDYLKNSNFDASIYLPGLLEPGKVNGKQYLLPKDYSPLAVYYNKKLFDAASVPYPVDGWTWDDLLAMRRISPSPMRRSTASSRSSSSHWSPTPSAC